MKFILPVFAMALAAPAYAQVQAPAPAQTASDPATDENSSQNRVVCKSQKATGSRLRAERVCLTKAQWAQKQRDERQATERTQSERQTVTPGG